MDSFIALERNTLTKRLNIDYDSTTLFQRATIRFEYITKQRQLGNNETFWDYLEFAPGTGSKNKELLPPWYVKTTLISSDGNVCYFAGGKTIIDNGHVDGRGYRKKAIPFADGYKNISIHRAVGSTYLPNEGPQDLEINHKNSNKSSNGMFSLEWVTRTANIQHNRDTGAGVGVNNVSMKPIRGTWIIPDQHFGTSFVLLGKQHYRDEGLDPSSIANCGNGSREFCHGCIWEYTNEYEEHEVGVPEVLKPLIADKAYSNKETKPLLGIILNGPYTGEQFVIFGSLTLRSFGFDQGHVSKVCSGKLKYHKGCSWKYIPRTECWKYPRNPTPEQLETL